MPPRNSMPTLEYETQEFDPFFPLSQEMKWSLESNKARSGSDGKDFTITILQDEIRDKDKEIEDLKGIIEDMVESIPRRFYPKA